MGKGTKSIAFYLMMILVFGSLMYFIVKEGESQQVGTAVQTMQNAPQTMGEGFLVFWDSVTHHIQSSMGILLLQIITILIVCRLFGWMFQKIGQPTVIGEIVAGIVLGPSVLGHLLPGVSAFLFPLESLGNITILSQFGLILSCLPSVWNWISAKFAKIEGNYPDQPYQYDRAVFLRYADCLLCLWILCS